MSNIQVLIFEHDIVKYPPILSVINFLIVQKKEVILIGYCSSNELINKIQSIGGVYYQVINNDVRDFFWIKYIKYFNFKLKVNKLLRTLENSNSRVWFFGEKCTWLLHSWVSKFKSNIYLFEVPSFKVGYKYKSLSPFLDYGFALQNADNVICCEYNRAQITKSFYKLNHLPIIIPNKPFGYVDTTNEYIDGNVLEELLGKKIILYQGIFNYPERKLDDFCEAMKYLDDDYVLCLMGSSNEYKNKLQAIYRSRKIIFLDYIPAPLHLEITKKAYIGILVYNGVGKDISNTLNTLYCAPNKVYEYAKYNIPMISNDVPALSLMFDSYRCGEVYMTDSQEIAKIIKEISSKYLEYSKGSKALYDSIDLEEFYSKII